MYLNSQASNIFKECLTAVEPEYIETGKLRTAALIRLFFIVPTFFLITFIYLYNSMGQGYHVHAQQLILVSWSSLALIYLVVNLLTFFYSFARSPALTLSLAYLSIFIELATNQIFMYSVGTMVSHAALFIIVIIASYRVFLGYSYALFAALAGGTLFTLAASLEIVNIIPAAPGMQGALEHLAYSNSAISLVVILTVQAGIWTVFFSTNYGMNQAQKLQKIIKEQSLTDILTGLSNRRHFEEKLENEWRRAQRNKTTMSLIMVDIDAFKNYNDYYGHPAGDRCLQHVAKCIKETAKRPADITARYGGEEFALLLPETGIEAAVELAEMLRSRLEALAIPHNFSPLDKKIVTVSLGAASAKPGPAINPANLVKAADAALYRAKNNGRNTVNTG